MREFTRLIDRLVDAAAGTCSAVWPRSVAAREITRLGEEGYAVGAFHEVMFAVSFDESASDAAVEMLRAAGFTVRDEAPARVGCTAIARIPLTAYHLHIATSRLQRLLVPYNGFAAAIGPMRLQPLTLPGSVRAPRIESSLAS